MTKTLRHWAVAVVGAAAAFAFSSCAYDPYYSSAGASYSTGYGQGYGYGSSNFSTSVFIGTGDARWGYDPYCYSYYDYHRHCYYDPYLHGYYPVGYRPPVIYGCPHPYGYRNGYCPPPSHVRYNTVPNYHNREAEYRRSNYGWARQVRQRPVTQGRVQDQHPTRNTYSNAYSSGARNQGYSSRENSGVRPSGSSTYRQAQGRNNYSQGTNSGVREQRGASLPSAYNTPITRSSSAQNRVAQGKDRARTQSRPTNQPRTNPQKHPGGGRTNQATPQERGRNHGGGESDSRQEEKRKIRGLGEG